MAVITAHAVDEKIQVSKNDFDPANPSYEYRFDTSKATKIFGITYRTMEQTTRDVIAQFKEKGWFQ